METSLKRSYHGSLYLANSEAIQQTCEFKIAEARENFFSARRKHLCCQLHWNYQYKPGLPKTKLSRIKTQSVWWCGHDQPGYYIRTTEPVISLDESETVKISIKSIEWAGELADLFGRGNTKIIHKAITHNFKTKIMVLTQCNHQINTTTRSRGLLRDLRTKYKIEFDASTPSRN